MQLYKYQQPLSTLVILALTLLSAHSPATPAIIDLKGQFHPVVARQGMVSTQQYLASQVGLDILQQGGNAIDAAVATGFALAVTLPKAGNIGGGGFMLIHLSKTNETIALDYREMAPAKAFADMFIGHDGNVDQQLARNSFQSAGVPGTVAGLLYALEKYGTMSPEQVIAPAIKLASEGFIVSEELALELEHRKSQLSRSEAGRKIFYKQSGDFYHGGEVLRQADLANTLKAIANTNGKAFYHGQIADLIVTDAKRQGGLIDHADLANYRVKQRPLITGSYRGYQIATMPPPSASGIHIVQKLNILENFELKNISHNSAAYLHILSTAMQFAFADRSEHLGDPDFHPVPLKLLGSKAYAKTLAQRIPAAKAIASKDIKPTALKVADESPDTTHFSVVDKYGNAVSNT